MKDGSVAVPLIRPLVPADEPSADHLLDMDALPGFVAEVHGEVTGVATYAVDGARAELAVLVVRQPQRGAGTGAALVEAVASALVDSGAGELRLVTTNDNLDALRFYQRRGFRLGEVRAGAVDASRAVKPVIPEVGRYGIPLRDELILFRALP